MRKKAIIVDDEKLAIAGLEKLIEKYCSEIQVIATCSSYKESLKSINSLKPDLVFLDIEMPQANGFELLESLVYKDFKLIFTTAYSDYAIKAIKVKAHDYLLKPIDPEELVSAIKSTFNGTEEIKLNGQEDSRLIINTQDSIFYLNQDEIMYLKSDGNYTVIKNKNGKNITVSQTLKKLEEKLLETKFLRIHHSYIVNQTEIFEFNKANLKITLTDGTQLPVSIRRRKFIQK